MIPKSQRFHTKGAIRRVMQHGHLSRGRHMMVRSLHARHPTARVAVVVSKKVYKSAVKRNRIRRRLYNIVRHEIQQLPLDITITVFSPEILVMEHPQLKSELTNLLQAATSPTRTR